MSVAADTLLYKSVLDSLEMNELTKDLKTAAKTMSPNQARFLVDIYYFIQKSRIKHGLAAGAMAKTGEPVQMIEFMEGNFLRLEKQTKLALDHFSANNQTGIWARKQKGIGPVLAAGLLAHINVEKSPTAGHIISFAGMKPPHLYTWEKGMKRPWNASLKRLCWLIGESFAKVSRLDDGYYGHLYRARRGIEMNKNADRLFADQAAQALEDYNYGADTEARKWYEKGMLPPARIYLRSKRWAITLFLNHYFETAYYCRYGRAAPRPYVMEHLGHAHFIEPPFMDVVPGMATAVRNRMPSMGIEEYISMLPRTVQLQMNKTSEMEAKLSDEDDEEEFEL